MNKDKLSLKNKIIVVLDDNEVTRTSLKNIFETEGAVLYSAGHLTKGTTLLAGLMSKRILPSLIITDVQLPGTYGFEVLRKIEDTLAGAKVPILLISRGLSDFAVRRASLYGVAGYARKPLLIGDLFLFSKEIIFAIESQKHEEVKEDQQKSAA